jgi:drug/metabolite transporter (DMT)-like permease
MVAYILAIGCVFGLAVGQILFKISATSWKTGGSLFAVKPASILFAAMCLYGITSVVWVWVLQKVELGRIYPVMALAFVLVPLGSHFVFGERFHAQYFIGVGMIMAGIFVAVRS